MSFTTFAAYVVTGFAAGSVIRIGGHGRAGDVLLAHRQRRCVQHHRRAQAFGDPDAVAIAILTLLRGAGTLATPRVMEA